MLTFKKWMFGLTHKNGSPKKKTVPKEIAGYVMQHQHHLKHFVNFYFLFFDVWTDYQL